MIEYKIVKNPVICGVVVRGWGVHTKTFVKGKIITGFDPESKEIALVMFKKNLQKVL